ncbi:hypothetical protein VTH06DRAFT_926 [Thermothelomyces fergusii]
MKRRTEEQPQVEVSFAVSSSHDPAGGDASLSTVSDVSLWFHAHSDALRFIRKNIPRHSSPSGLWVTKPSILSNPCDS